MKHTTADFDTNSIDDESQGHHAWNTASWGRQFSPDDGLNIVSTISSSGPNSSINRWTALPALGKQKNSLLSSLSSLFR